MVNVVDKLLRWFSGWTQTAAPEDSTQQPQEPQQAETEPPIPLFPEEINTEGERRSEQRQSLEISAGMLTGSFGLPESVVVRSFSTHGVYFQSNFKVGVGQIVQITMTTPDTQEQVRYDVKVVRATDLGANRFGIAARITRREVLRTGG